MDIITGTTEFRIPEETVVSIGKFDGVHKGHIEIIKRMREYVSRGYKLCILTFDNPPASLGFGSDSNVILSNDEKRNIFSEIGIDYYIEFPFYEKTASIPAKHFIEEFIVDRMNAKAVIAGSDCSFGQGAEGNAQMLLDFGPLYDYEVEVINKVMDGKKDISSTYLKELLASGNVRKFMNLAYFPYYCHGRFKQDPISIGGKNVYYVMDVPENKMLPIDGVYYSTVIYEDELYDAITNVRGDTRVLETYIYDGVRGIERADVSIALLEFKHGEERFRKTADMNRKIKEDIFEGQKWHKEKVAVWKKKI